MDLGLAGKVAFVAGSSRGIGLAIAHQLAREGAYVTLTGRNEESLTQAAAAMTAEIPSAHMLAVRRDMTDPLDIARAVSEVVAKFGGLDVVVANVGSGMAKGGWELDRDDWESGLRTNLLGSMALASASLPHLISRGGGSLIFISSIAGWEAINAPITYSAAKAALLSTMKNLSRLVGPQGVRVNAVVPGNVLFPGGSWERKLAERSTFFEQYIRSEVPLQRFGTPEEIADVVAFLSSSRASFVTGACLIVDGGQTRSW